MKLLRNLCMAGCAGIFALASCGSDKDAPTKGFGNDPVVFKSGISTRAVDTQWSDQDAIGVYMIEANATLGDATIVDGAANKKYTTTGNGKFVNATPNDIMRFPNDGSNVDFIAYYPYEATINDYAYAIDVTDQGDPEKIDAMYAKAEGFNKTDDNVELQFDHMLSAVRFNVTDQAGDPLTGIEIEFNGLPAKASMALATGVVTPLVGSEAAMAAVISEVSGNTAQGDAILVPQTVPASASVTFTVSATGKQSVWDMAELSELEQNVRHIFKATFKSDGSVTVTPEGNINGWTDKDEDDIDLNPQAPEGDGTKTNPYYIGQVGSNIGATGVWVQAYIVGTEVSSALVTSGFTTKDNIVLAASADVTDLAECVVVTIAGDIQDALNLVDHATLLGALVKVAGDIATANTMNNVIDQEGGITGGTGEPEEFFNETFGETWRTSAGTINKPFATYIAEDRFDMMPPYTLSTSSDPIDIRCTNTYDNPHLWFSAGYDKYFRIEGIEAGYTKMSLTYDLAANSAGAAQSGMMIKCNNTDVTVPTGTLGSQNEFSTLTVTIPDGTTVIEFYTTSATSSAAAGYRIDNVIISGAK